MNDRRIKGVLPVDEREGGRGGERAGEGGLGVGGGGQRGLSFCKD